jgi:ABC-2 type transport system ATP-binding protein
MLSVRNLRKEFETVVAVDGISFEVHQRGIFGFLGPNGAGKTTTLRTVLNIIKPNSGEILFDGKPFVNEIWNHIGYLPEERGLYRKSKVINTITYFASLKGMNEVSAKKEANYWLERFSLKDRANAKIEELSKGNQQKIQFIISIVHRPSLLIMDEPFAGLDPVNQILLKDILMEVRKNGTAVIFSTHQMEQAEKMCDEILLINKGKMVLSGGLSEVKSRFGKNFVHLEFDGNGDFLKSLKPVKRADIYQNFAELELAKNEDTNALINTLSKKILIKKFEIVEPSLNSIFLDTVSGDGKDNGNEK